MTPATLQALKDFRSDKEKVASLRKVLSMPIMVEVMNLLNATAPQNTGVFNPTNDTNNNTLLGGILGYTMYANRLKDLATHVKQIAIVEADYAEGN